MDATGLARRGRASLYWESTGDGPPVLLIMGLGMAATGWWRTVPVLARDLTTIAFDHRGVGRSSPVTWTYTTDAMADDAAAVLDAAGVTSAHVYGLSLGGMVAQRMALRHPHRVRSLVLGATHAGGARAPRADTATREFFRRRARLPAEEAAWASVPYNYGPRCRREHADRIAQDIEQRLRFPVSHATYRAQLSAAVLHNCFSQLDRIRVPTLVVHGEHDRMVPLRNAHLLGRHISGARLEVITDAGHFYPTEQPDVDALIARFIVEADGATAP